MSSRPYTDTLNLSFSLNPTVPDTDTISRDSGYFTDPSNTQTQTFVNDNTWPRPPPGMTASDQEWRSWAIWQPSGWYPLNAKDEPITPDQIHGIDQNLQNALDSLYSTKNGHLTYGSDPQGVMKMERNVTAAMRNTLGRLGVSTITLEGASRSEGFGHGLWASTGTVIRGPRNSTWAPGAETDKLQIILRALQALSRYREPTYTLQVAWICKNPSEPFGGGWEFVDGHKDFLMDVLQARSTLHDIATGEITVCLDEKRFFDVFTDYNGWTVDEERGKRKREDEEFRSTPHISHFGRDELKAELSGLVQGRDGRDESGKSDSMRSLFGTSLDPAA